MKSDPNIFVKGDPKYTIKFYFTQFWFYFNWFGCEHSMAHHVYFFTLHLYHFNQQNKKQEE